MTPDHAHHFFVLSLLALGTIVLVVAMRAFAAARQGRRAAALQTAGASSLAALQSDIAEMKARLASVETLLREVG